jgi:hypothetical protein
LGGDAVADVPEVFVEEVFHALVQDFYRGAHGAYYASADDSLGQFQVVEAKEVDAFVKIQQALGYVVQAKKFGVAAVQVIDREVKFVQLRLESFAQAGADVEQGEKAWGVEAAAVSEAGANQVVVVGRDGLELVQHRDGIFQYVIAAAQELGGVEEVSGGDEDAGSFQFEGHALQEQFGCLVNDLEGHLVGMQEFFGGFLQGQQVIGAEVAFVVRRAFAGKNGFSQVVHGDFSLSET